MVLLWSYTDKGNNVNMKITYVISMIQNCSAYPRVGVSYGMCTYFLSGHDLSPFLSVVNVPGPRVMTPCQAEFEL